jgi:hypothetical protein
MSDPTLRGDSLRYPVLRVVGRGLQIAGLVALPVAMVCELTGTLDRSFGLSEMLLMLVFGTCCFYLGRFLESFGHP